MRGIPSCVGESKKKGVGVVGVLELSRSFCGEGCVGVGGGDWERGGGQSTCDMHAVGVMDG